MSPHKGKYPLPYKQHNVYLVLYSVVHASCKLIQLIPLLGESEGTVCCILVVKYHRLLQVTGQLLKREIFSDLIAPEHEGDLLDYWITPEMRGVFKVTG